MRISFEHIDPVGLQGSSGGAWFIATGITAVTSDGSIAQQYITEYDTEPVWLSWTPTAPTLVSAPLLGYQPLNLPITHQPAATTVAVMNDPAVVSTPEPAYGLMMLFVFFALYWAHKAQTIRKGWQTAEVVNSKYPRRTSEEFDFEV